VREGGVGCVVEAMKNHLRSDLLQEYACGVLWNLALRGTAPSHPDSLDDLFENNIM